MRGSLLPSSWIGRAFVGLVVWYVVVLLAWGIRPLTDDVPLAAAPGQDEQVVEQIDAQRMTQAVDCGSPVSGDGVRGDLPVPDPYVDEVTGQTYPVVYDRAACTGPVRSAQWMLGLDTVVLLAGSAGLGYLAVRRRPRAEDGTAGEGGDGEDGGEQEYARV